MQIGIRFTDGTGAEFETTLEELDAGFSRGYFRLVRGGETVWIPVGAVLTVSADVVIGKTDRGFKR
jgi:hypothetical protein